MKLHEVNVQTPFNKTVKQDGKIGFEFECCFPLSNEKLDGIYLDQLDPFDLDIYFNIGPDIKEQVNNEYKKSIKQVADLIGVEEFVKKYNLVPKFGWITPNESIKMQKTSQPDNHQRYWPTLKKIRTDLKHLSIMKVIDDGTIEAPDGMASVEIITNPIPKDNALDTLHEVFAYLKSNNAITNNSTSLHINVSVNGIKRINKAKLLTFFGEKYVSELFERPTIDGFSYSASHEETLSKPLPHVKQPNIKDMSLKQFEDYLNRTLTTDKFMSFNLNKLKHGYIEFRVIGGDYLNKPINLIIDSINRFVNVLDIACSDKHNNEYYRKLQLLQYRVTNQPAEPYPTPLDRLYNVIGLKAPNKPVSELNFKEILPLFENIMNKGNIVMDKRETFYMKQLFNKFATNLKIRKLHVYKHFQNQFQ